MEHAPLEDFASRVRGIRRTQELDAAAVEALAAFDADGTPSLLLKGAALARLLYTADKQRGYSDVDLLVGPDHLASARRALSELGYANSATAQGVEDIAGAVHAETWIRRNEQIGPLMVDLHTRLPGVKAAPESAWQILYSRRTSIDLNGRAVAVLSVPGLAMHVAIHAAQHGPDDPRPLADLRYALERWSPEVWQDAARLAADVDAVAAFAAGLRLVPAGAQLASELSLPATDDLEWEMLHRAVRPRGTFHLQALTEAASLSERLQVVRRALLPKREWITWEDPRARQGGIPLLAARIRHFVRTPIWALKALRYRRRARRARP